MFLRQLHILLPQHPLPAKPSGTSAMGLSTFTLITSDQVSIQVDAGLLGKHSSIFADMFNLPSNAGGPSCTVSESESELRLMIEVFESNADKGSVEYNLVQITELVKLADKYDAVILSYAARVNLW